LIVSTFIQDEEMMSSEIEKIKYVSLAVGAQLQAEGKPVNDWNLKMGDDLKYDIYTIRLFLVSVEATLSRGYPSYDFDWDIGFAKACLGMSIMQLIGAINAQTN
jgi:hypothetical protein